MRKKWFLCPLVTVERADPETGDVVTYRAPKVAAHVDPARGKPYQFAALTGPVMALCLVRSDDFSALEGDPAILDIFEMDYEAPYGSPGILNLTLNQLLWPTHRQWRLRTIWTRLGVSALPATGLTPKRVLQGIARLIGADDRIDEIKI